MTDTTTSDDWLQVRHNKWNTPPCLINEYERKATGSAIAQASRVVLGLDNEVYVVIITNHHPLIVRISHKENHRYAYGSCSVGEPKRYSKLYCRS